MTYSAVTLVVRPDGSTYRILTDKGGRHYFATYDGTPHPVAIRGPHEAAVTATIKPGDKVDPLKNPGGSRR